MWPSLVKPGRERKFIGEGEIFLNPEPRPSCDDRGSCSAFPLVRVAFACCDQALKAVVDIETPRARAFVETLIVGNEALMSEPDLGLVALACDLENHLGAVPLGLVLREGQIGIQHQPDDLLVGNHLNEPL